MEIENLFLWGIGLIVTIVVGFLGRQVLKSSRSQNQSVSGSSVGIQSGKDTKIDNSK
jgi:hypothetical protein